MNRKEKARNPEHLAPCSSYPEAEAGVEIFSPATRLALRRNRAPLPQETREPIVSIYGRDVEELPDTKGRAA